MIPSFRFLLACSFLALNIDCQAQQDFIAKVDKLVDREMRRQHIPGVSLAVITQGQIMFAKGYGMANVELQVPVKPETIFQSGSVGKQFTATAVMMLVEAGKMRLDDSIGKYLKKAPESWGKIKVYHLLTHTSGMADDIPDADYRRDFTEDELLARMAQIPLKFQPGEKWSYSNLGYKTLGIIIGRVTGKFYGQFLRERIFKPCEMKTARIISEEDIVPNRAAGYRLVKGELKNQEWVAPMDNTTADGSLYLTVYDLAKWDAALYTEKLLKKETLEQMWTPVKLNNGSSSPYGFGWSIDDVHQQRVVGHDGSWQGFESGIERFMGDKMTVVVFGNLAGCDLDKIIWGVAALYDPQLKR